MRALRACWLARWCLLLTLGGVVVPALLLILTTGETARSGSSLEDGNLSWVEVDPAWMAAAAERMSERRRHLRAACAFFRLDAQGNDSQHRANPWEFLVDRKHHLVWCNVFKAASTSWMYNFNLLAGYSRKFLADTKLVPLTLARRRYPRPSLHQLQEAVNDSVSFLIVRHPLERLLSAYRDKLQFSLPHSLHQRLGNHIILRYRGDSGSTQTGPRWPTFAEFVAFLVDTRRRGEPFDMHWAPVSEFCTPCQVPFTVVAKFETLEDDQRYLIAAAGLQELIRPEWRNPSRGRATSQLAAAHFAQLTRSQVLQLYDIYQHDFELFGYTLDGYLDVAMTQDPLLQT